MPIRKSVATMFIGFVVLSGYGTSDILNAAPLPAVYLGPESGPTNPKVPFGNSPCKSLTLDEQKNIEQKALGYSRPTAGKPDRAPGTLPFENVCSYEGYVDVGYMTKGDYDVNSTANRSSSHTAPPPADLPQAFYSKSGLWFAKNGYYVVISGKSKLREDAARIIAGKL